MATFPVLPIFRLIALGLFLWAFVPLVQAQDADNPLFQVIYVQGRIERTNGKALAVGDRIYRSEKMKYPDGNALAAIFNAKFGRLLLPEDEAANKLVSISSSTGPPTLRESVLLDSLQERLSAGRYLILNKEASIDLYFDEASSSSADVKSTAAKRREQLQRSKFVLQFQTNGQKIRRTLPFNENGDYQLQIRQKDFLTDTSGQALSPESIEGLYQLYLVILSDSETPMPIRLTAFEPVFLADESRLLADTGLILEALQASNVPADSSHTIVSNWIAKTYVPPLSDDLWEWLSKNFNFVRP